MSATPITDAAKRASLQRPEGFYTAAEDAARDVAALAAAALAGPLVEDVECPDCGGDPDRFANLRIPVCPTCAGTGTVRLVVHVVTPGVTAVAELCRNEVYDITGADYDLAAAILDPQGGDPMSAHDSPWNEVSRIVDERDDPRAEVATLRKLLAVIGERHRQAELLYRAARDDAWKAKQQADRYRRAIAQHRTQVTLGTTVDTELWEVLGD